jgi:hypothetical protein
LALPAAAATVSNTSPWFQCRGYNTPSYNKEAKGQQTNGADSGQQTWMSGSPGNQSAAGQGWSNQNSNAGNAANVRQRIYQNLSQAGSPTFGSCRARFSSMRRIATAIRSL